MASVPEYAVAQPPAGAPERAHPNWPLWMPLAAIALGVAGSIVGIGVLGAVLEAAGTVVDEDSPELNAAATLILDLSVVAATLAVIALVSRPRAWQLGLRRGVSLGSAIGLAALAAVGYFIFALLYAVIFTPENPQDIVEDLGADESTLLLVAGAVLVIAIAPVAEELFFRGFLYRVLRQRMAFWLAAAIDGVLFGLVHGSFVILPVLAFLGFLLCWTYERTGTLFVPIALHALNNALAYGVETERAAPVLAVGGAMIAACILIPAVLPRRTPAPV